MDARARLVTVRAPRASRGVVLVLHGGASRRSGMRVSPTQLSVLRMVPIARRIARAGHGELAVLRLLNSVRGWDASHTPVQDVAWALQQVAARYASDTPVCLVGHSLGGRAAILSSGHASVRGAVALNPFVYPEDGDVDAHGHEVVIVHGTRDRIAPIDRARGVARRLQRTTTVTFDEVPGGKHAMLREHGRFGRLAADAAVRILAGAPLVSGNDAPAS